MAKKNKKYVYFLAFGLISFVGGQILSLTHSELGMINFLSGLFMGLSIPLNMYGIFMVSRNLKVHAKSYVYDSKDS